MLKLIIRTAILGYFGLFMAAALLYGLHWFATERPPEQPIAFPHTVHAGELGLPCTFCHIWVEKSPQAGVPPLQKCMSCHQSVAVESPEIRKLTEHYQNGEPVRWERVHTLPDFIYFTHKRHVKAGLDCAHCHGDIPEMETVRRVRPLQMGWCISCHWGRGASTDCATCHI